MVGAGLSVDEITDGITSIAVNAGGTGYVVGDILSDDSFASTMVVMSIGGGGAVTGLDLYNGSQGASTGTGIATTDNTGAGTGCTIDVLTVGASNVELTIYTYYVLVPNPLS